MYTSTGEASRVWNGVIKYDSRKENLSKMEWVMDGWMDAAQLRESAS